MHFSHRIYDPIKGESEISMQFAKRTERENIINKLIKASAFCYVKIWNDRVGSCDVAAKTNGSSRGRCLSGGHHEVRVEAYEAHGRARAVLDRRDS